MSATDKVRNKIEKLRGGAKKSVGRATGDRELEDQGSVDQFKSDLKDAGEKVKDAFGGGGGRRRRRRRRY